MVLLAYDLNMMLNVHFIFGQVAKVVGKYEESQRNFKAARDISSEMLDMQSKMAAYNELAEAYSLGRSY